MVGAAAPPTLRGHLSWYRDSSASLDINRIVQLHQQGRFLPARDFPSFGYTRDIVWISFSIRHHDLTDNYWLLSVAPAFLDQVQLFSLRHSELSDLGTQGDRELLATLFNNILDNAVKYSPADSRIEVSAYRQADNSVCIRVRDHGRGMTEEERLQVLEKYFRATTTTDIPGMGLGMGLGCIWSTGSPACTTASWISTATPDLTLPLPCVSLP